MSFMGIVQKKGDPHNLDGHLTVYARVDLDPSEVVEPKHPIASMIHNGLLVAQGNYRDQNNLRDFLKSEMGLSLEEGLGEFIEKLDGLESALDPQKLKDKMDHLDDIQDFIPTPAKIVPFNSEEEIISQQGDVFFTGMFKNVANANLSVNSFPILYQARFREQQIDRVKSEIEQLIFQVERTQVSPALSGKELEQKILKEYIPQMLYCRNDKPVLKSTEAQFRKFLGERFEEDATHIIKLIERPINLSAQHYQLLELYARKIAVISSENYSEVDSINQSIADLEKGLSE
ncbi:MAG: hypothetical protein ACOC4C_03965 [Fibrobacterota bacterium]